MKLGTSSPLAHTNPENWAQNHISHGLEAINFHLTCNDNEKLVDDYLQAAGRKGLMMAEVGVWRNTLSPNPQIRSDAIRYAIGQLQLAEHIEARCCVNIIGSRSEIWDGACRENFSRDVWNMAVETIRTIIDAVKPKHTYFTIESMPWMIPTGPDEYLRLLDAVERDRFAVHLDVFNWMCTPKRYFFNEEFVEECFEKLGRYTRSCHLKDVKMEPDYTICFRETAPGDGRINIRHLIKTAEKYDINMPFIIEHLNSDESYLKSVRYVQSLVTQ